MSMPLTLARVPLMRVVRAPRGILPVVGWIIVAIASAVVIHSRGTPNGADHVMRGSFGRFILPLIAYGVVSAVLGTKGLRRAIRGVVALGASPAKAALAAVVVAAVISALVAAAVAVGVAAIAHGSHDPPLARDALACMWISALGGAAYASFFAAGSAIGKGAMRAVFFGIDWILGAGAGFGSIFVPRGHLESLFGGALAADVPQRASTLLLVVLAVAYAALAVRLSRRA